MFKKSSTSILILVAASIIATGCAGPPMVEKNDQINPSETAFLVPLEGATKENQTNFGSVEYLVEHKVAAKRVIYTQRKQKTGRMPWSYVWIPTQLLIKVDRAPVTREWTTDEKTGTGTVNQAMHVKSSDNIGFWMGATITASIEEGDAATFQYNFGGKPLHAVLDENVRGFCQQHLAGEIGQHDLAYCQAHTVEFFNSTFEAAKVFFKAKGVTLDYFGSTGGFHYDDTKIQDGLNARFIAENDQQVAQMEQNAQNIRNQTAINVAEATRKAAQEAAKAKDASQFKNELDIRLMEAQARLNMSEGFKSGLLQLPANILPAGSPLLLGIDKAPKGADTQSK